MMLMTTTIVMMNPCGLVTCIQNRQSGKSALEKISPLDNLSCPLYSPCPISCHIQAREQTQPLLVLLSFGRRAGRFASKSHPPNIICLYVCVRVGCRWSNHDRTNSTVTFWKWEHTRLLSDSDHFAASHAVDEESENEIMSRLKLSHCGSLFWDE